MEEVRLAPRSPEALAGIIGPDRLERLVTRDAAAMRSAVRGHSVININSTPAGGGVAEMLQVLLPLIRGADIDARWLVIEGDPEFFSITKRLHLHLHGEPVDGQTLGAADAEHYESVMKQNIEELSAFVAEGDVVILHDPQTAGIAEYLSARGIPVVWRCHVGVDGRNEWSEDGWAFLRPYLEPFVDAYVFTRAQYAPPWVPRKQLHVIRPSIDPLAPKNHALSQEESQAILAHVGILDGPRSGPVPFTRSDGTPGRVERFADLIRTGPPPPAEAPLVVQVSRWDPLKDMVGVMQGFVDHVLDGTDAHLVLAGPVVTAVADDLDAALELDRTWEVWRGLHHHQRSRVQLVCLPMSDIEENAIIVNALQRHASVVTQKSLAEGFGLTVTEAMFKGVPVVASNVGGISDQIVHGESGLLVESPHDLADFGANVRRILEDPQLAARLGEGGRRRAIDAFLPDTSLGQWEELLVSVMASED